MTAAKLTPAQIRTLRDPNGEYTFTTLWVLASFYELLDGFVGERLQITDLGREVLAVLDKEAGK